MMKDAKEDNRDTKTIDKVESFPGRSELESVKCEQSCWDGEDGGESSTESGWELITFKLVSCGFFPPITSPDWHLAGCYSSFTSPSTTSRVSARFCYARRPFPSTGCMFPSEPQVAHYHFFNTARHSRDWCTWVVLKDLQLLTVRWSTRLNDLMCWDFSNGKNWSVYKKVKNKSTDVLKFLVLSSYGTNIGSILNLALWTRINKLR